MKRIKKFASFVLAMIMVLAMALPAMAAGTTAPTGSITIKDSDTVKVEGKTFDFYRILNATLGENGKVAYTVPEGLENFYITHLKLDVGASNVEIVTAIESLNTAAKLQALAKAFMQLEESTRTNYKVVATAEEYNAQSKSITYSGLPYGYYLIDDKATDDSEAILMLDTTMPNAEIVLKANLPKPSKSVDKPATSIGDPRLYTISAPIPNMEGYDNYRFVFNDVLTRGLTFTNEDSETAQTGVKRVVIATFTAETEGDKTIYKPDEVKYELTKGVLTDGTVTGEGMQLYALNVAGGPMDAAAGNKTTLTFTLKDFKQYWGENALGLENYANYRVFIEYYVTPNEYAVTGVNGNTNEVELWYENNPNSTSKGDKIPDQPDLDDPVGRSEKVTVDVFTTQIELTKTDNSTPANSLAGAQFSITGESVAKVVVHGFKYVEAAEGEYWGLKGENGDVSYTLDDPNTPGMNKENYVTNTDGSYKKYSKVAATIEDAKLGDAIGKTEEINAVAEVDANGKLIFKGLGEGTYTIREVKAPDGYNLLTTPIEFTVEFADGTFKIKDGTANASNVSFANEQFNVTVVNSSGSELPSTGGIGTTIFYVVGGILVAAAGILLVTKKRMSVR